MTVLTNRLASQPSLYLRQHANNPVAWQPWDEQSLQLACDEQRLLVISIGYAACHWCHVMEHESFDDAQVAAVMNAHFVPIKIDRETRPDLDAVYMDALQLMNGQGGWPLNIIALPDGRPVYGGTYFRKNQWLAVLEQLATMWQNERSRMEDYANKMQEGTCCRLRTELPPRRCSPFARRLPRSPRCGVWRTQWCSQIPHAAHAALPPRPSGTE